MIEQLKAALDLAQRHAEKTIHLAGLANDPASWQGHYGYNHPASYIKHGAHITIARIETLNHQADTQYLMRAAKRALRQAHEDLRMVAAVRDLAAEFKAESDYLAGDLKASGGRADGLYTALKLIAKGYGIEVPE